MKKSLTTILIVILLSSCSSSRPAIISFPKEIGRFKLNGTERVVGDSNSSNHPRNIINIDIKPPDGTTQYKAFYTLAVNRTLVIYSILVFPTTAEASEEMDFFKDKVDVIERGSKLDALGRTVGERIVQDEIDGKLVIISWNEGTQYRQVYAEDLNVATEFEDALLKNHSK